MHKETRRRCACFRHADDAPSQYFLPPLPHRPFSFSCPTKKNQIEKPGASRTETRHPRRPHARGKGRPWPCKTWQGEHEGGVAAGAAVDSVDGEVSWMACMGDVFFYRVGGGHAVAVNVVFAVFCCCCCCFNCMICCWWLCCC